LLHAVAIGLRLIAVAMLPAARGFALPAAALPITLAGLVVAPAVIVPVVHVISPLIEPIATRLHASLAKAHDFLRHIFQLVTDIRFTHRRSSWWFLVTSAERLAIDYASSESPANAVPAHPA
jgi:hypothetical protein